MGKQSSRLYYQGKDHKEIYYQGHYHDAMYIGSTLVWEKVKGDAVSGVIAIVYADGVYYAIGRAIRTLVLYEGKSLSNMSKRGTIFDTNSYSLLSSAHFKAKLSDGELKVFVCYNVSYGVPGKWVMVRVPITDGSADMDNISTGFGDGETYFYSNLWASEIFNTYRGRIAFTESAYFYIYYETSDVNELRYQLIGTTGLDGDNEYENTWGKWNMYCTYYTAVSEGGDKLITLPLKISTVDSQYYVCIGEYDSENNTVNLHPVNLDAVVNHCSEYCEALAYAAIAEKYSFYTLTELSISVNKMEALDYSYEYGAFFLVGNNEAYVRLSLSCTAKAKLQYISTGRTYTYTVASATFYYNVRLSLDSYSLESFNYYEDYSSLNWKVLSQAIDDAVRVQLLYSNNDYSYYVSYGAIGADYTEDTYIALEYGEDISGSNRDLTMKEGIRSIARTKTAIIVLLIDYHIVINTKKNTAKFESGTLVYA